MNLYRRGFNNSMEGAQRLLELRIEIGEEERHECPDEDFATCEWCDRIRTLTHEHDQIRDRWATEWAVFVTGDAYPLPSSPTWCECGHISGQHGINYPHVCATGGHDGCENGCTRFTPAKQPQETVTEGRDPLESPLEKES